MRVICEACGTEVDRSYGNHLHLIEMSGMGPTPARAWCRPCGELVLQAMESVKVPEMARVVPLRATGR